MDFAFQPDYRVKVKYQDFARELNQLRDMKVVRKLNVVSAFETFS